MTESYVMNVDANGIIHIEGLPPNVQVRIIVGSSTFDERKAQIDAVFGHLRTSHPFVHMSEEEILLRLRKTREEVWEDQYGHLS